MVDTKKNNSSNTKKNLMNAYKTLRTAESKMDYCAIIGSIYLIVIRLRPSIIGDLYEFFCIGMGVCGLRINKILSFLEIISVISICLCIILRVSSFVEKVLWDFHLEKLKGNNRFEQSALRYMREKGAPHCFLVSGDWGSGKTYDVNDFLEKYYFLSSVNIYRVSCFGLRTRNEVIEEINNTIERADTSLIKTIIVFISDVPLLGEPLNKLIGRTYSYEKVKKGSVFVFDDFERITSRTATEAEPPDLYKKDVFFKHHLSKIDSGDRGIIDEEFEKIESAFKYLRKEQTYITDRTDYDKYVSVAGLINELIITFPTSETI